MRAVLAVSLVALLCPVAAVAQSVPAAAPAGNAATRGGDITKDQYIEHAVERAKRAAQARFDRLDTNHDGVLTAEERRAARAERAQRRAAPSQ